MIVQVADIVKSQLSSLTFIDKLAGLVKPITKTDLDANNRPIKKTFPVACDLNYTECITNGRYKDLVPNSNIGCMVYLEDNGGIKYPGMNGRYLQGSASYRIVGWINGKKLGSSDCSITGQIITAILTAIPNIPKHHGNFLKVLIDVSGQDPKSYDPFSKYSYDEDKTQYKMYPFDYFSLPITVNFEILPECFTPFAKGTEIKC